MSATARIKRMLRRVGIDLRRVHNSPEHTWLGLRRVQFETIVDVGANRGQFAREALDLFPNACIHCFEPLPEMSRSLRQWAADLGHGRVFVHQVAVGDELGRLTMHEHVDHSPSSSLLERTKLATELFPQTSRTAACEVDVVTLDHWAEQESVHEVAPILLKIDVQGYESAVLRGASVFLRAIEACVIEVSTVPLYLGQARFAELVSLLDVAGLVYVGNLLQVHARDGSVLYVDAVFRRSGPGV